MLPTNEQNKEEISTELKKYVFDPENPKDFVAYDLILSTAKTKNCFSIYDVNFIAELNRNKIFDKEFDEKIWDKPDNYHQLNFNDKIALFEENLTNYDYQEYVCKKALSLRDNFPYMNIFHEKPQSRLLNEDNYKNNNNYKNIYFTIENKTNDNNAFSDITSSLKKHPILFFNFDAKFSRYILHEIKTHKTAIVFITLDSYIENMPYIDIENGSIKPILLKKIEDIHLLLDILYRDINESKDKNNVPQKVSYINKVKIENYFSLKNIELDNLANKREIYLLGENGDGKTILLQSILLALKGNENEGVVNDVVKYNYNKKLLLSANDSNGENYQFKDIAKDQQTSLKNIFAYGVSRFNTHKEKKDKTGYLTLFSNDQYLESPVNWLQYIDHKEAKGLPVAVNLEEARKILSELLDKNIDFEVTPDDVQFFERGTKLSFDQLSDGYKSVISWTADLITRLSVNQPEVRSTKDFKGIVLIDEIDMFLHPKWEYTLVKKLRNVFAGLQFIFTTHSPVLILGASNDAVFYKVYKENAETKVSAPLSYSQIAGSMANTLLTHPIFDLEYSGMRASEAEPDTSYNFRYSRISKKISERLAEKKKNGKVYFSTEEIDSLIGELLNKEEVAE